MTARKYNLDASDDILSSERQEILSHLGRLNPTIVLQQRAPR